jgi:hypothetical protein
MIELPSTAASPAAPAPARVNPAISPARMTAGVIGGLTDCFGCLALAARARWLLIVTWRREFHFRPAAAPSANPAVMVRRHLHLRRAVRQGWLLNFVHEAARQSPPGAGLVDAVVMARAGGLDQASIAQMICDGLAGAARAGEPGDYLRALDLAAGNEMPPGQGEG